MRPRLTVDLGLRYDWNQTPYRNWRTRVRSNLTDSLTPPGTPAFKSYYGNWAPRIGIAWMAKSKLVLRAGYGFFIEALLIGNLYNQVTNTLPGRATFSIIEYNHVARVVSVARIGGEAVRDGLGPVPARLSGRQEYDATIFQEQERRLQDRKRKKLCAQAREMGLQVVSAEAVP